MSKRQGNGRLDIMDGIRWQEQAVKDAFEWLFIKGTKLTEKERTAYTAGHAQGWRDCLNTLSLHGIVVTFDRDPNGKELN